MILVELKNVSKSYLKIKYNFVIKKGEKVLIKGYNGVGKSTLAKILTNYIKHDTGEIVKKN